jgi:hypothetical protein
MSCEQAVKSANILWKPREKEPLLSRINRTEVEEIKTEAGILKPGIKDEVLN